MPDTLTVVLPGWDEFAAGMDDAARVQLADLEDTDRAAAQAVAAAMATAAPKLSGRLAGSIRVSAIGPMGAGGQSSGLAFTDVVYAGVIDWGWPGHGIAASNFSERAATSAGPQVGEIYEAAIAAIMAGVHGE